EFTRSCCSIGTRIVLKPMAISNSCVRRPLYVRRWGDPGDVSPFHAPPLGERSEPWSLSSIMRTARQARSSAADLSAELNALLPSRCVHRARRSWQLQHRRVLAFAQPGEQHSLSVGELQRIVMHHRLAHIDLPELRYFLSEVPMFHSREKNEKALILD